MWIRPASKPPQCLAEPVAERWQCQRRPSGQITNRASLEENLSNDLCGHSDGSTPTLSAANSPGSLAGRTLPAPLSEVMNQGLTTGGFRMLSIHTCELSLFENKTQTEKETYTWSFINQISLPDPKMQNSLPKARFGGSVTVLKFLPRRHRVI